MIIKQIIHLINFLLLITKTHQTKTYQIDALNTLNTKSLITVSGLSSGGFFANQFHIAYSSIINGAAIFTAGPYYCAKSSIDIAESICMKGLYDGPQVYELVDLTNIWSKTYYIDNVKNLVDDNVYLYHGSLDSVINSNVAQSLKSYYKAFMSSDNIKTNYDFPSEHCMPTLSVGSKCSELTSPYIGHCNFDGAGEALNFLYRNKQTLKKGKQNGNNLFEFDQIDFIKLITNIDHNPMSFNSISQFGYIYIPTKCIDQLNKINQTNQTICDLHISFHGCLQNLELINNSYASNSGFNDWGEENNIIILYPYIKQSNDPFNPNGCWDWWGYTGLDYVFKTGYQMQFIKSIIDKLFGK